MSDDIPGAPNSPDTLAASSDGRRQTGRRLSQQPVDGPERRQADRRSGTDRRASPRAEGLEDSEE